MSDSTPQRIGDYEIISELGHGGMGRVYKVRNVLTDRIEAMKVVLPDLAGRHDFLARFMREIKTLASLDHPNIAVLRTAFSAGDQFAMVMEYVEGVTLADKLARGPMSTADALNYIDQVLSALSYAHARHVIHRDIKPANMMLTPQGVVKLMDFGLARSADEIGLTVTGSTLGSLDYSSPEQVQAQPTDERSDIYSVGVSLYQMVTGKRMFGVTSSFSIMQAQVKEMPRPPIEVVPTIPKSLSDAIMFAVAKDPAQRFQSAEAFRTALSQVTPGERAEPVAVQATPAPEAKFDPGFTVPAAPSSQSTRNVLLVAAVLVLAALIVGAIVYKSFHRPEAEQAAGTPVQAANAPAAGGQGSPAPTVDNTLPQAQPAAPQAPPTPPEQATTATSSPAVVAHKAKPPVAAPDYGPGPSAADLQAQQQAALEQKQKLDEMEKELDHLDGRAASVESSLDGLEQQMHQSGLGLRGDMVAARVNMRTDIAKAKQAMDASDTERARHFIDLAQREVEKLEGFLGRR